MDLVEISAAIQNLSVSVIAIVALAVVLYFMMKLVMSVLKTNMSIQEGMTKVVQAVHNSEEKDQMHRESSTELLKAIKELVGNQTFTCDAQKYFEEMKKQSYHCPRKDELEQLRKETQR